MPSGEFLARRFNMVFSVVLHQMGVFFLIVIVGMAASRLGVVKRDYLKELASLVS